MDVCILAGGLGSRLEGVWSGPKCLVPVGGVPVLERILDKVFTEIAPDNVVISLGSQTKALEVIRWWSNGDRFPGRTQLPFPHRKRVHFAVEPAPLGRLRALVSCLPALSPPILVLNGDTLPRYDLKMLGGTSSMAMHDGRPAGAFVLSERICQDLSGLPSKTGNWDLDGCVLTYIRNRITVPGFLDVGTPAGFAEAQQLTTAEG